ncbi:hypothetical protein VTK26DRAFT_866 [Humicola hyalothermophila]
MSLHTNERTPSSFSAPTTNGQWNPPEPQDSSARSGHATGPRDGPSVPATHSMFCLPRYKRRLRRRSVLALAWLFALFLALVLWLRLHVYRDHAVPAWMPGMASSAGGDPNGRPTVTLPQGTYVGTTIFTDSQRFPRAVEVFRNVPYAQDTGGDNRFRPPQPLPKSDETFDAITWGLICPSNGTIKSNMGENCLNANIYRPAKLVDRNGYIEENGWKKRARLPVAVYVHGGGFNTGSGDERNMGSFVAWSEAPLVAVNFNYRVGPLGFLPSDVTAREGLLNLGLRDQQMLLQWVQDNIEAFGGDPENVTVMGLSAGAHSIGHHIMYYARQSKPPPFAKAIIESGAATARSIFYPTHPRHLVQFREFLIAAGAEAVPEDKIFPVLRKLPLQNIIKAAKVVWDKYEDMVTWPFQPVIDGPNPFANSSKPETEDAPTPLIYDLPINAWRAGQHLHIPVLTGYCTNEGTPFIPQQANKPAEFRAFFQNLIPSLTEADLDKLEELYPDPTKDRNSPYKKVPRKMGKQWARLDAAYSHYAYICPVLHTAHFMSQPPTTTTSSTSRRFRNEDRGSSNNNSNNNKVYVYRYAATAEWGTANHGDEAPVVVHDMEEVGIPGRAGLLEVSKEMCRRWARFVATGSPNPPSPPSDGDGRNEDGQPRELIWPAFVSPAAASGGNGEDDGVNVAQVMVFGEGNDERGGGSNRGVPAQVQALTELEREACRFWWERVALSEGLGRREGVEGEENAKAEAKL